MGADTIAFGLKRAGIKTPSRRTVNRILQRQQLVVPRVQHAKAREMPADYPWPSAEQANAIHLFDFNRTFVGRWWTRLAVISLTKSAAGRLSV